MEFEISYVFHSLEVCNVTRQFVKSCNIPSWYSSTYDEDILPLQTGNIFISTLDALGDLTLVLVAVNRR